MFDTAAGNVIAFTIICALLILLLVAFIIFIVYRYKQKQNLYFKNIEELKNEHEKLILKTQLEIQEQTIQTISSEIHDNIGQKLTLAKLYLRTLNLNTGKDPHSEINDVINIITRVISDLSNLSHSLSSNVIIEKGLITALQNEIDLLNKGGVHNAQLVITGESIYLSTNTELVLFRIVQEAINNIIKHAEASQICIYLLYEKSEFILKITDNGKGFSIASSSGIGVGLSNIKKRAINLNGTSIFESNLGKGSSINIKIPLYENI